MFFLMTPMSPIFCVAYNALVLPVKQWLQKLLQTHPQGGQLALCTGETQHRVTRATLFSHGARCHLGVPSHIRRVRTCVLCHEMWHSNFITDATAIV